MFAIFSILLFYLISTPLITTLLRRQLESFPPFAFDQVISAKAIVVIGADRYRQAPEFNNVDTIGELGLQRARYAAWLQQRTGLPILASGGLTNGRATSEGAIFRQVLQNEFKTEVHWIEEASATTYENAINSAKILKQQGIKDILLVTHAWHMQRAFEAFVHAGFKVTPACTAYYRPSPSHSGFFALLPSTTALYLNRLCLHEVLGRLWYHIRYYQ